MKVVEIRQEAELLRLRSAWERLLGECASNTIFLTWEWITAWWSVYGKAGELRVLAAFDENDVLRGIAPLRSREVRRYGQSVPALSFVGDGSNDSDYLDFIVTAGHEEKVLEVFQRHWLKDLGKGAVMLLNEIPANSPNLPCFKRLAEAQGALWKEAEVACGTVRLPQTWEEYLGILKPRFRTKVRSVLRSLEARPEVRFGFCENAEQVERLLPVLFDLHTRRWAQDGKPGVFGSDRKRGFYAAVSPHLLDRNWLRFSWLEWNGRILACQYGFEYGGAYFQLQEGYEPAAEHRNPGLGLRAWTIREFLKRGLREYDFLGGVGRHKTDWGAESKQSKQILVSGASLKNIVFSAGPEWEERVREYVKRFVPKKALAARQARLEQQQQPQQPQGEDDSGSSAKQWLRKAAAGCYFHFRVPQLMRPLRDQYQLSFGSNGRGRRLSWSRRKEAAARILYYHRVNDEGDPFFPAISTRLFEQQMAYVARHYKVVAIPELLDRLQHGSPESVIAITFDDGYRDNYDNAFPVLQRYGLPATIFLATGSMDSRQPLWFEQLALALKKSCREYLDLDLDIPRRFWLRTQTERLDANRRIFAFLRGLQDGEREQWLQEILRQIGAGDDQERQNRMLTWEQVRQMKAHGVDFGGHTVTHPFISKLARDRVSWEVSQCKRRIEEESQCAVEYFAYPNGREEDFAKWNKEVIRDAGYRAALTTIWGLNYRSTDPMELRRGGPWEQTASLFAYKLDWYQLVND